MDTPLHHASCKGHTDAIQLLIGAGADVNKENNSWCTPIQCALQYRHTDVVQLLESYGARE